MPILHLNSLGARIAVAVMIAILATATLVTLYELDKESAFSLERSLSAETHRAELAGQNFRAEIVDLRIDLKQLEENPAVREYVSESLVGTAAPPDRDADLTFWQEQVAEVFETLIAYHPHYRQVRLIGIADKGRELIRVDQPQPDRVLRIAEQDLQQKVNREYFQAALQLEPGQIHLSEMNLNRERGEIEVPYWPTIRGVIPVFAPTGSLFGMIVINMDVAATFGRVAAGASDGSVAYLVKDNGDFLIHPDRAKTFGVDLGHPHRWQTEFPNVPLSDTTEIEDGQQSFHHETATENSTLHLIETVFAFDPENPGRNLHLFYGFKFDLLSAFKKHGTFEVLAAIFFAAFAFCALIAVYLRRALVPLNQLAAAAKDIAEGKLDTSLPTSDLEEISPLATAMSEMRQELQVRESSPVMMHSINPEGQLVFVNEYWLNRLGYSREEVLGRHISEFLSEDSQRKSAQIYMPLFLKTGRLRNVLIEFVTKSGEMLYCLLFTRSLRASNGSIIRSLSVMVDVTQEKHFEAAFRESEEKFQQAFESAGHGIALLDPAGIWIQSNRKLRDLLGLEEGEPPAGDFLASTDDSNVQRIRVEVGYLIDGARDTFQLETELLRYDGQRVPVMLGFGVVRDANRSAKYLVCHVTDLTDLKTAEARFMQAQKMEAVGNLTGGIAHDFNNLLGVILGNLQLLQRRLKDRDDLSAFVEDAISASRRGADLTKQLLAFSRRQTLEPKPVRVNEMIVNMEKLLARTLGTHIEIELCLAPDLPAARVDPVQLESAILNLAINARDAMPDGGSLSLASSMVTISAKDAAALPEARPGKYVCIEVSDSGHGMPAETLQRVFEPFFTTKPLGKGTGLGLSMVYGFIKQSGGHVNAYSEENTGTRFTMYLPVTEEAVEAASGKIVDQPLPRGSESILLVDDEPQFLKVAAAILTDLGYSVSTAPDGPAALEAFAERPDFDLLITDIVMPGGLTGHQLADRVRELRPDIPVLLASGFPRDSFAGGRRYPFIQKPYLEDALARKVREVCDNGTNGTDNGKTA